MPYVKSISHAAAAARARRGENTRHRGDARESKIAENAHHRPRKIPLRALHEQVVHGRAAHAERGELVRGELGGAEVDEVGDDGGDAGGRWMSAIEGGREKRGDGRERQTYAVMEVMFSFLMRLEVR